MTKINKVIITGSSGGIGSAICNKFRDNNFTLILTSSSEAKLEKLKEIYGKDHHYYQLDLSDNNNLQNGINEISKDHKDISVIVNNAGITEDNLIFRMKNEQWNKIIQTNLTSNYQLIKPLTFHH